MTLAELVERWARGGAIAPLLRELSLADTLALAAKLRTGYWHPRDSTASIDSVEMAGLLSMHRNGYVRAAAVAELLRRRDPFALRFLVMRLDDIVETTREQARAGIWDRLSREYVDELVALLPVLDAIARRSRATSSEILRDARKFLGIHGIAALRRAADAPDRDVRRAAIALLIERVDAAFLVAHLDDPDPRIRRMIAVAGTVRGPRDELLPHLAASRDPELRRWAVKMWGRESQLEPIYRMLTDERARVREAARKKLEGRQRRACLDALAEGTRIVGALGGLAEVGVRDDAARVIEHTLSTDARVRAEAYRTLRALDPEAPQLAEAATDPSARVRRSASDPGRRPR